MDKETFDSKLKQAKRQQEEAEEELLSASDKWRSEKRKLNSEIDRLEAALVEAKGAAARKRPGDAAALAKIQEEAEEKFIKASATWEAERTKLKSQINRLEGAVAEAIARSSNPMRATQSVREQFETELLKLAKEKTELEQAFLRLKTESEQEKLKTSAELVKLRRAAQIMGTPVAKETTPEANPKIRDLQDQLQDGLTKWNSEREKFVSDIQKLQAAARLWDTERRQLNDHASQLQQAFVQAQAKIQGFESAAQAGDHKDVRLEELQRQKQRLEQDLQEARNDWENERRSLNAHADRIQQQLQRMSETRERVSDEVVDQLRKQYEQRLQEAIQQKTQLARELQDASALLESQRATLAANLSQPADDRSKDAAGALDTQAIAAEVARVEKLIGEIVTVIDNPETELSTVIRKNVEKSQLDSYLKGILFSIGRNQGS